MFKTISYLMATKAKPNKTVPVLTIDLVQFRRTTRRYGKLGTFSTNKGYLMSNRDLVTGQFVKAN
jgi:hypothetical protein